MSYDRHGTHDASVDVLETTLAGTRGTRAEARGWHARTTSSGGGGDRTSPSVWDLEHVKPQRARQRLGDYATANAKQHMSCM